MDKLIRTLNLFANKNSVWKFPIFLHRLSMLKFGWKCMVAIFGLIMSLGCSPKMEECQTGSTIKSMMLGIRNLTVVEIIPGVERVGVEWKGFDTLSGNAFRVGHEVLCASDSKKTFLITDKCCGNNQLCVNGVIYSFNANNQRLVVSFVDGIRVETGVNYSAAKHVYDKNIFLFE